MPSTPAAKSAAAGVMLIAPDGKTLFLKRGGEGDHPGEWCFPGGGIEAGEGARAAARREAREETGFAEAYDADFDAEGWRPIHRGTNDDGVDFTTFMHSVGSAFEPTINDEHVGHSWAPLDAAPEPLHPSVKALIDKLSAIVMASDSLAFDEASARKLDKDGHLFVEMTNISKANVCPYKGSEIPGCDELGLDPDRVYKLLRDPEELAKAAPTFRGKPLMLIHQPVSASDHPHRVVVGSVGTDVIFESPYLKAPLSVWPGDAIALIDSGEQKELSSSYHYKPDMTPGTYEGESYDGVMRDIAANHVALVKEGRAGPDVVVGDSKLEQETDMPNKLTRKALIAHGALLGFVTPRLAADAKIDLLPALDGVTAENFKEKRPSIVAAVKAATQGKLAKDASIDEVAKILEVLDDVKPAGDAEAPAATTPNAGGPRGKLMEFLNGKLSADDMKACDALFGEEQEAMDEADKDKDKDKDKEKDKAADEEPKVTEKAMDAAIGSAVTAAQNKMRAEQRAVREAEELVRPYVGKLAVAMDSAEDIYKAALTTLNVKIDGVHPSAFKALLTALPVPGSKTQAQTPAMDAAGVSSFQEMFPETKTHQVGAV